MIFPTNALTIAREVSGTQTVTLLPSGIYTILGISTQQENTASLTEIRCGTNVIATNYAVTLDQQILAYSCNGTININKTGNDKSFTIITYVPNYLTNATSSIGYNPTTNIATTTDIKIYGSMSAGEVMIAFLLFSMIVLKLGEYIARSLGFVNTKKHYIGYSNADVEIRTDL